MSLFNEECAKAVDMGDFYRVPADNRGLNYDKYFKDGDETRNTLTEFNSNNTRRLNLEETKATIAALSYIQERLAVDIHIHNIVYDEFNDRYIIMTGDEDKESALWEADTDFNNVKMIVGGSQKYRACVAFPTSKGIFYATDTPLEQNWLYFLDKNNELHEVYKMPGPCIYGRIFRENLYLATSVEGDPTLGGWKYRLSNKLGAGVQDRYVHITRCSKDGQVEQIAKFQKDMLPMWLFQFGNAQFPPSEDGVYISTQSTVKKGTYEVTFDE